MSHVYITESGTFEVDIHELLKLKKFWQIVKKCKEVKTVSFENYVFNKCLICKNCSFENAVIDVYCDKQGKQAVHNSQVRNCRNKNLFEEIKDGESLCEYCIFWNTIIKKCAVRKNEQSSALYPVSCNFYKSQMMSE